MDRREEYGRRSFISLVEVEHDDTNENDLGWVTFDSFAESSLHYFYDLPPFIRFHDDSFDLDLLTLRASFKQVMKKEPAIGEFNGGWVRIVVDSRRNEEMIPAEVVMFGDNAELPQVAIAHIEKLSLTEENLLRPEAMLYGKTRSYPGFISGVLDIPLREVSPLKLSVAVYDVGQGNCNAIVDIYEHPLIYFDLGWSPNFHAKSRPHRQPDFFACEKHATPPVVLSHWDMDHWCHAIANSSYNPGSLTTKHEWKKEALQRFWIARAPQTEEHKLGPLTQSFYRALERTELLPGLSAVLLWPDEIKRIPFSAGWLEACQPTSRMPNDRNNSGIAMFVRPNPKGPAILLTGDADFPCIPSVASRKGVPLAGLVAPHHGARITSGMVPRSKKGSPARLVMSVGAGNSYGHPKQDAINAYQAKGWLASRTQDRFDCTRTSEIHQHGNTLLKFNNSFADPQCGCHCVEEGNLCLVPAATALVAPAVGVKKQIKAKKKVEVTP